MHNKDLFTKLLTEDVEIDTLYTKMPETKFEDLVESFAHAINIVLENGEYTLSYDELISACSAAAEFVATHAEGANFVLIEK